MHIINGNQFLEMINQSLFNYFFVSNLVHLIALNNVRKKIGKQWNLTNREIVILITALLVQERYRHSYGHFRFTELRILLEPNYLPYEVNRSLRRLCDREYVIKIARNRYTIGTQGSIVLRQYSKIVKKESHRLTERIQNINQIF